MFSFVQWWHDFYVLFSSRVRLWKNLRVICFCDVLATTCALISLPPRVQYANGDVSLAANCCHCCSYSESWQRNSTWSLYPHYHSRRHQAHNVQTHHYTPPTQPKLWLFYFSSRQFCSFVDVRVCRSWRASEVRHLRVAMSSFTEMLILATDTVANFYNPETCE